jgi:hypothetical protein
MATILQKIIDPGGTGDYLTFVAALADKDSGYSSDLVSEDTILRYRLICTNGQPDLGGYANIDGFTSVDATRYIDVVQDLNYFHGGIYPVAGDRYRLETTTDTCLLIQEDYTRVHNMCTICHPTGGYPSSVYVNASNVQIENHLAIVDALVGTSDGNYGISTVGASGRIVKLRNNIVWGRGATVSQGFMGLVTFAGGSGLTVYANHCTFISPSRVGIEALAGNTYVPKNCIIHGTTSFGDVTGTLHANSTNNAHFHHGAGGPASGANWLNYSAYGMPAAAIEVGANLDQIFRGPAAGNCLLLDDTPIEADGIDLSSDANFPVTTDILGNTRGPTYYLGAHQNVTPASDGVGRGRRKRHKRWWIIERKKKLMRG